MSEISLVNKSSFKNIKSIYFVKLIFSYFNEKTKLEIIKYNKTLQNIIDIKLTNYMFLSQSYIIYETNGKGKEYNGKDDSLIFEGEYLNGKRNGKGKEYNCNDYLEFEGEYLNGKKNGKGKEYYKDNKIKFEGEFKNRLRWNGKGYDNNNHVAYELKNGKGYVKEYDSYDKILVFEGEYLNGRKNGKCKEYHLDEKLIFEGEYLNGKRNGNGKEYYSNSNIKFEGEYLRGLKWNEWKRI